MIRLNKNLGEFYKSKVSLMNILCLKSAFSNSVLEEDIWTQEDQNGITAVIARNGGRLYIYSNGENISEIKQFINIIGFSEIFTEEDTAKRLGLSVIKEFNVLKKESTKTGEFDPYSLSLNSVYQGLKMGCDGDIALPPYADFAPDLSHRLRHGAAVAIAHQNSAATAFLCKRGGIISGISVSKDCRGQGLGSTTLNKLCSYIGGQVFVCANQQNKDFYIKNGFSVLEKAVIAR
jgi:hypothetical protein